MKNVGLLTCYMDNFGACLQAYALQRTIVKFGCDCEIIKYTPIKSLKEYNVFIRAGLWLRNHIKSLSSDSYKFENYRHGKFVRFRKEYLVFSKENYMNEEQLYSKSLNYDAYVTGSDQIWNPNLYGGKNNRIYFLDFVPDGKKRIAYAPSIGVSTIPEDCAADMGNLLSKFDAVSVRESDGKRIIDGIIDCNCRVVLDPTLLLTKEEWSAFVGERIIKDEYILLYLFGDREYTKDFINYAYEKTGLKIITIPFNKREYESDYYKIKRAGPIEFVNLIKNAKLVITDSFHATAFSINLNVPFYSLLRNEKNEKNNMNSRIYSILDLCGLQDRIIADKTSFPKKIDYDIDFQKANVILADKRSVDYQFLRCALDSYDD